MSVARAASIRLSSRTDAKSIFPVVIAFALSACHAAPRPVVAPAPPATSVLQLQRDIDAILAAPALARSYWGVVIKSEKDDEVLYALNAGKLLMPGSTMKLATLAAAAERLGWDYTFETQLTAAGTIDSGALNGDLVIVGSGDPAIGHDEGISARVFVDWAEALKSKGVSVVTGGIIGDDNAFDDEALGPGWAWDDLAGRDAVPVSALQFNENTAQAIITPGSAVGTTALVTLAPPESDLVVDDDVLTTAPEAVATIVARRSPGSGRLELRGTIPLSSEPLVRVVSVDNPTLYFATALRAALIAAGIDVRGPAVDIDDLTDPPPAASRVPLATHRSPPLSELAVRLMKNSQNLYAETLMKTLGATAGTPTFERGPTVVAETLLPWGIAATGLVQVDGSGLSRYNYITADTLLTILTHVNQDTRLRGPFETSLPIAGVDGTLTGRMKGTAAEGNAHAKSGTLANVRSLAGYVASADGEPLTFAIIANNFGTMPEVATAAIDAIVVTLAEFRR